MVTPWLNRCASMEDCIVWDEQIRERIMGEIQLINHLFTVYADLLTHAQQQEPGLIRLHWHQCYTPFTMALRRCVWQ